MLDDHSRYVLSCTAHAPVTGDIVVAAFRAAIDAHGIPASTLTDNGLVFTTRFLHGPNDFERELVILGIDQKNGRPNHPQTQGKVERFQQTLKKWLRAQPPAATLRDLQAQLDEFTDTYNHTRPHRSLGKRTPAEVYAARAKATPTGSDGHWRVRHDKVASGRITLRHGGRLHHIGLGYEHNGHVVRVLVHDLHVTVVHADTGEIIRDLELDPTATTSHSAANPDPSKASPNAAAARRRHPRHKRSPGTGVNDVPGLHKWVARGLEPRTYGLKAFPITPQGTEYQAIATDSGPPGPSQNHPGPSRKGHHPEHERAM